MWRFVFCFNFYQFVYTKKKNLIEISKNLTRYSSENNFVRLSEILYISAQAMLQKVWTF